MPFSDFHGNAQTIARLREMLASGRFPHAVVLAGPEGAGKYTLAQMLAKAMNCLNDPAIESSGDRANEEPTLSFRADPEHREGGAEESLPNRKSSAVRVLPGAESPDFCGVCANCLRIAQADDLEARCAEAVEVRENLRDADKKDTRVLIQTHPDVMVIPPDPPQMLIKVGQVRQMISSIYFKPTEARRKVYIFTDSAFMKEAANSLLKVLEEPPDFATIFLLAQNTGELLPTIRSRCVTFTLSALPVAEIEQYLAERRPEWAARQRSLVARLSGGAIGKAKSFDLEAYTAARKDPLLLLSSAIHTSDHSELFKTTETYRAGADGSEKTDKMLRAAYSLLEDLMFIKSGAQQLVRNTDILSELAKLAGSIDFAWLERASQQLGRVESGMRRNLLRSLSLDAFAVGLER